MSKRKSYEEVKAYIESFGYKLLSKEYINAHQYLLIQCDKGHKYKAVYNAFQQGKRCPYCNGGARLEYKYVKEYIESFGYKLLSTEYKNCKSKLLIKCNKGHKFKMNWNDFQQGNRCPYCANKLKGENKKHSYEYIKNEIEKESYKLLSKEYINAHEKLLIQCNEGHIYEVEYNSFQQGRRCPICNISKGERKIINWLKNNNIKYIYDQPYFDDLLSPLGNPLRPDFIIEDRKIWIEFDGEFHYEEKGNEEEYKKTILYDEIKNEYAKKNNWKLIRIPYWEINNIEKILEKELF